MTLARLSSTAPDCRPDAGYGDGDSTQIQLCHELPHRLRFRFQPAISPQSRIQIEAALEQHWVPLHWRDINQGQGLVIYSDQHTLSPKTIIEVIQGALSQPKVHQVAPPPSRWHRAKQGLRQGSIKLFLALAIAGWVLPILPGTPFFLVAWWLGWRPPAKEQEVASPTVEMANQDKSRETASIVQITNEGLPIGR
jgi:hypothetical protein